MFLPAVLLRPLIQVMLIIPTRIMVSSISPSWDLWVGVRRLCFMQDYYTIIQYIYNFGQMQHYFFIISHRNMIHLNTTAQWPGLLRTLRRSDLGYYGAVTWLLRTLRRRDLGKKGSHFFTWESHGILWKSEDINGIRQHEYHSFEPNRCSLWNKRTFYLQCEIPVKYR